MLDAYFTNDTQSMMIAEESLHFESDLESDVVFCGSTAGVDLKNAFERFGPILKL